MTTENTQMTMDETDTRRSEIELNVYLLAGMKRDPEKMLEYTGYRTRQQIPAERITDLKKMLARELAAQRKLGAEEYQRTRTLTGKLGWYRYALDKIARISALQKTGDRAISWQEFSDLLRAELDRQPDEDGKRAEAFALGAGTLDESGYVLGDAKPAGRRDE